MTRQGIRDHSPLFTVIIPTENRAEFLKHTLRTCMMQDYEPFEVIVSDDCGTDNTREVVEEASRLDRRIRYITPGVKVGMRDNFEYALRQVRPGFVIALGGDDGLLPGGISGMYDVLRDTGLDLLAWPAPVYSYPHVQERPNGQLLIFHRQSSRVVSSADFLRRQAKELSYIHDLESPMFYVKGVTSTTLIDRVRSRSSDGRFYSCATPDGYSGIVLAGEVSQYAFSGKPFSIYGLSKRSQGIGYLSNDQASKAASNMFFHHVSSRPMHSELASQPYSPLITLMTADYLLTARDLPGWPGTVSQLNYRQVLQKGLTELSRGDYGEERVCRELRILCQVAEKHGLGAFFRRQVGRSWRRRRRDTVRGTGINRKTLFLDGLAYNIQNVYDAAYAAQYITQAYSDLTFRTLAESALQSFRNRVRSMIREKPFPAECEWNAETQTGSSGVSGGGK